MKLGSFEGKFQVSCHDVENNDVLVRLYYPTDSQKIQYTSWLSNKAWFYTSGYLGFMKLGFLTPLFYPLFYLIRKPCAIDFPISQAVEKFPTLIFSHGLGGNRTTYSAFCGNLASHGFVVASLEHRDGSASATARFFYKEPVPFKRFSTFESVPGVFEFRREQIAIRVKEVFAAVELLKSINNGDAFENHFPTNNGEFSLSLLKGKLNLEEEFAIAGHSFGGATTIDCLQKENHPFKCGIVLDPWMYPTVEGKIHVPVYSVQSETFHWETNINRMHKQFKNDQNCVFAVIKGIQHQSFSDFPLLFPGKLVMGGDNDKVNFKIILRSCYEFLALNFLKSSKHLLPITPGYFDKVCSERDEGLVLSDEGFKFIYERIQKSIPVSKT